MGRATGRLVPRRGTTGEAAVEVKPKAAVEWKSMRVRQREMRYLLYQETERIREEEERKRKAAAEEDERQRQADPVGHYRRATETNGCTVGPLRPFWSRFTQACNRHDVAYGRGGSEEDRKRADKALAIEILLQGAPRRALITYMGLRVGGRGNFSYRDGGPLPIPEGAQ